MVVRELQEGDQDLMSREEEGVRDGGGWCWGDMCVVVVVCGGGVRYRLM